jgi:GT2 family glycosyltransferase
LIILIVSYGNPSDVERCLRSLARSHWADFEIFLYENASQEAFSRLLALLTRQDGPLQQLEAVCRVLDRRGCRLDAVARCQFRGRGNTVWLAVGTENLGYAGGVNAWLERLLRCPGWEAALVLNPDTEISETCLAELMAKAAEGCGMVGASLVFDTSPDRIMSFGLHWSRWSGRTIAVGRNSPTGSAPPDAVLASIDVVSGSCMLLTRKFIEEVGPMVEDYFLYMEDLDWGLRRGRHKIGLAVKAVVRHIGGASIGSPRESSRNSPLAVYLASRNNILFSRRWAGWRWPLHFAVGLLYVVRYAFNGSLEIATVALVGLIDGARGKTGRPDLSVYPPRTNE